MERLIASPQLVRRTVALVLAGGRGARLKQLTDRRAKPAVYFGGKFRIIDFALSNCVNSGIRRIGVVMQYESHSLLRHLQHGWSFLRAELNEMVDLLPAQMRMGEEHWYRGTADAVLQNLDIIRQADPQYIIILAGDHIYKMDYSIMLRDHVAQGAGCTVGCIEVPRQQACAFGVMAIDEARRVTAFVEKPTVDYARSNLRVAGLPEGEYLTVFGQYVIKPEIFDILAEHIENNVRERGEFQLTSALDRLRRTDGFLGRMIDGARFDIGQPDLYLETLRDFRK